VKMAARMKELRYARKATWFDSRALAQNVSSEAIESSEATAASGSSR